MHSHRYLSAILGVLIAVIASQAQADFSPPADGRLTEKQMVAFIEITKEQLGIFSVALKRPDGTTYSDATAKVNAAVARNGMSENEFAWVDQQFRKLWAPESAPYLQQQILSLLSDSIGNKVKLEMYKQAQKDGKRVLTQQQCDVAIAAATSDRDNLTAEVKTDEDAIKPISDEIAQHDKDAVDAEASAKTPSTNLSADDKNAYIDQKKNDAQAAEDAAKDGRERLREAQTSLDDAKARLGFANSRMAHPELPVTDDDKNQVKAENDQAIARAKAVIANDDKTVATLKITLASVPQNLAVNGKDKIDSDNLSLVQKHLKEYLAATVGSDVFKGK